MDKEIFTGNISFNVCKRVESSTRKVSTRIWDSHSELGVSGGQGNLHEGNPPNGFSGRKLGVRFQLGENPPSIESQPWYRVTLLLQMSGMRTYTVDGIADALREQIDPWNVTLNDSSDILLRISRISCWNMNKRYLLLNMHNFVSHRTPRGNEDYETIVGCGVGENHPSIGFQYPTFISNFVIRSGNTHDGNSIVCAIISEPDARVIIHIDLFWRADGPVQPGLSETVVKEVVSGTSFEKPNVVSSNWKRSGRSLRTEMLYRLKQGAVESTFTNQSRFNMHGRPNLPVEYHGNKTQASLHGRQKD